MPSILLVHTGLFKRHNSNNNRLRMFTRLSLLRCRTGEQAELRVSTMALHPQANTHPLPLLIASMDNSRRSGVVLVDLQLVYLAPLLTQPNHNNRPTSSVSTGISKRRIARTPNMDKQVPLHQVREVVPLPRGSKDLRVFITWLNSQIRLCKISEIAQKPDSLR